MVNVKPSLNIVVMKILTDFDGLNLDRLGPERARAPTPTATSTVGLFGGPSDVFMHISPLGSRCGFYRSSHPSLRL